MDDLRQVATLGLINAVDRYDPDAGSFVRYAVPTIMGELKRHFRDKRWALRVPRSLQERGMAGHEDGRAASMPVWAARPPRGTSPRRPGFTLEEVLEAMDLSTAYSLTPLDAPFGGYDDGARTLGETLGSDEARLRASRVGPLRRPGVPRAAQARAGNPQTAFRG